MQNLRPIRRGDPPSGGGLGRVCDKFTKIADRALELTELSIAFVVSTRSIIIAPSRSSFRGPAAQALDDNPATAGKSTSSVKPTRRSFDPLCRAQGRL